MGKFCSDSGLFRKTRYIADRLVYVVDQSLIAVLKTALIIVQIIIISLFIVVWVLLILSRTIKRYNITVGPQDLKLYGFYEF